MMRASSAPSAARTAGCPAASPFDSAPTRAPGASAARTASTRSTTTEKRGCSVGSPLPENVIQSGTAGRRASARRSACATSSGDGQREPGTRGVL